MKLYESEVKVLQEHYRDDVKEKLELIRKHPAYKDFENCSKYRVGISDKGNLVLTMKNLYVYSSDEWFKNENERVKRELARLRPEEYELRASILKSHKSNRPYTVKDMIALKVFTRKLIITLDGRIYYVPSHNSIRRLSIKKIEHFELIEGFVKSFNHWSYKGLTKHEVGEVDSIINYYLKNIFDPENILRAEDYNSYFGSQLTSNYFDYMKLLIKYNIENSTYLPKWFKSVLNKQNQNIRFDKIDALNRFLYLKKMKMTNVEAIKKIISPSNHNTPLKKFMKYYRFLKNAYANTNVNVDILFANRITNSDYCIQDSIRIFNFYHYLKGKYKDKNIPELKKNFHKMDLVEAHNYLSALIREVLALVDYNSYKYSDDVLAFNKDMGDYNFQLVRNSSELVEIAKIMNNCVAGYNQQIKHGSSIIVFAESRKEGYANLCIELSPIPKKKIVKQDVIDTNDNNDIIARRLNWNRFDEEKRIVRQCYEPYNHNITNPEVISICKEYFGSIGYEWESYPERQARYQRENPGRVIF